MFTQIAGLAILNRHVRSSNLQLVFMFYVCHLSSFSVLKWMRHEKEGTNLPTTYYLNTVKWETLLSNIYNAEAQCDRMITRQYGCSERYCL